MPTKQQPAECKKGSTYEKMWAEIKYAIVVFYLYQFYRQMNNDQQINYMLNRRNKYERTDLLSLKFSRPQKILKRIPRMFKNEQSPQTETKRIKNHKLKSVFSKSPDLFNPLFHYKQDVNKRSSRNDKNMVISKYCPLDNHDFVKAAEINPTLFRRHKGMFSELGEYQYRTQLLQVRR